MCAIFTAGALPGHIGIRNKQNRHYSLLFSQHPYLYVSLLLLPHIMDKMNLIKKYIFIEVIKI